MSRTRRLAVIMFTDIVGYTALMGRNEQDALQVLRTNRDIHKPLIEEYDGEWLKEMGDGILASFQSSSGALRCAARLISDASSHNIELRIGIHLGEVVFQDGDIFGDGVNIASRLETLAVPSSVLFTGKVHDDIRNKPDIQAVSLGKHRLKNVDKPIEIWALNAPGLVIPPATQPDTNQVHADQGRQRPSARRWWVAGILVFGMLLFLAKITVFPDNADENNEYAETRLDIVTLAALPFSNIAQNEQSDYLGFALADQVINSLSYLQNVAVRPSSSIRKYNDINIDPQQAANELGVEFVLTGHFVTVGDSVRLNLELIDVKHNTVLWSGSIQEEMSNVFRLQDQVAKKVIDGLKVEFSGKERDRMNRDTPGSALAYEYYLRAVAAPKTTSGNQLALDLLEKSIELDSSFAPAYGEIGHRIHQLSAYKVMEERLEENARAVAALEHALDLNGDLLRARGIMAIVNTELNRFDVALHHIKKILDINPNSAWGHFASGYVYRYAGVLDSAIYHMEEAVHIDPNNSQFRSIIVTYNMVERYEEAVNFPYPQDGSGFIESWRGFTYIRMNDLANARIELLKAISMDPEGALSLWCEGMLSYARGERWSDELREEILEIEKNTADPESMYTWGLINSLHGDQQGFLRLFERAVNNGYYPYPAFQVDPVLDPLRDNPEFQRIMQIARRKHEEFKKKHL